MSAYQVCVRGSGIVGKSLALGLARQGLSVAWVGPAATPGAVKEDVRTYALSPRSVAFLRSLKAIGAGTPHRNHRPLSPAALRRVMARFDQAGATATYVVATCHDRRDP